MNKSCPVIKKCGKCHNVGVPYKQQLTQKQKKLEQLLKPYCKVHPIEGMDNPFGYCKSIKAVVGHQKGEAKLGVYKPGTHNFVPVDHCLIEDEQVRAIAETIRKMLKSFKIRTYDENSGYGLLRYIVVKKAAVSGQILAALVTASPVFPSKNNFVKALKQKHPEITTIVQNVNERVVNTGLGQQEKVLYGKGYIEDQLGGFTVRITARSKYPANPMQAEVLYKRVAGAAGFTGKEVVLDAYGEGGMMAMTAAKQAARVIGVESSKDDVRLAADNAKANQIKNVQFYQNDADKLLRQVKANNEKVDVVIFKPSNVRNTVEFFEALSSAKPKKVVYVSGNTMTLEKDFAYFAKVGYKPMKAWGVDVMPWSGNVETVCLMSKVSK